MPTFAPEAEILVFGGPYSNLRALDAMRAEADRRGIPARHVICTGDVVAYCAEPEETTAAVRTWGCHAIAGNCEQQLAAGAGDCGCGFEAGTHCDLLAKGWYPFADARVSAASRAWMAALPASLDFRFGGLTFRVVHGGVATTNAFVFASETARIAGEFARARADVVIGGHAGLPFIARTGAGGRGVWFNPGVIGMPANDGCADVWYGTIHREGDQVVLSTHRLAYDHRAAAAATRRFAHADGYARTLVTGLWPSLDILPAAERAATGVRLRPRRLRIAPASPLAQPSSMAIVAPPGLRRGGRVV